MSVCMDIYAHTFLYNQNTNNMKVVEIVQLDLITLVILDYKLWKDIQVPTMENCEMEHVFIWYNTGMTAVTSSY